MPRLHPSWRIVPMADDLVIDSDGLGGPTGTRCRMVDRILRTRSEPRKICNLICGKGFHEILGPFGRFRDAGF